MTVSELIRDLEKCEQNLSVFVKKTFNFNTVEDEQCINSIVIIPYPMNELEAVYIIPGPLVDRDKIK